VWAKLKFAPARGLKAPTSTPRLVDVISLETVVYGAAPHGKTRYNLASPTEASQRVGQAGVFLTYIEFEQEQHQRAAAGEAALDIADMEARIRLPDRELMVATDDDDDEELESDPGDYESAPSCF
jgi:hypothetical protein